MKVEQERGQRAEVAKGVLSRPVILIAAMEALYLLYVHAVSVSPRATGLGWPLGPPPAGLASMAAAAALAALMVLWLVSLRRPGPTLGALLAGAALFGTTLLLAPAQVSGSLMDDMGHGRVLAHYGANPYVTPASTFPPDAILGSMGRSGATPLAGPAWITLASLMALAGAGRFTATVLLFKSLLLAAHLINGFLIGSLAAGRGEPRRLLSPGAAAAFYLWNPLVVTQTLGEGRHHAVALSFLLLSIWLVRRGDEAPGWGCAAMACLVDYVMTPVAALLLVQRWRGGPRPAVFAAAGAAALVGAVAYTPYVPGLSLSQLLPPYWLPDVPAGARAFYEWVMTHTLPSTWLPQGAWALWCVLAAALLGWWLKMAARVREPEDAGGRGATFLMAALLSGAAAFELPAVAWVVALATLAPGSAVVIAAGLLSAGAVAVFALELHRAATGAPPQAMAGALLAVSLIALSPPILSLVLHFRGRRSGGPRKVEDIA